MEGRDVFVEIDSEEVQVPNARVDGRSVVLKIVVEIVGGFGSYWANLLVAPSIARNEKYGDSLHLCRTS